MAGRPGRTLPQPAAPARKGKGPAAQARKPAAKPTVLGRIFARPGLIVAGASFAAIMTGIVANALILQKGHHPSPLFSPAATAQPVPVPLPVPRQALEQPVAAAPQSAAVAPAFVEAPAAPVADVPAAPAPVPHTAKKPVAHTAAPHAAPSAPVHKSTQAAPHKVTPAVHKDPIAQLLGKAQ